MTETAPPGTLLVVHALAENQPLTRAELKQELQSPSGETIADSTLHSILVRLRAEGRIELAATNPKAYRLAESD